MFVAVKNFYDGPDKKYVIGQIYDGPRKEALLIEQLIEQVEEPEQPAPAPVVDKKFKKSGK